MESALAGAVLKSVMGKLFQVLDREYNKQRGLGQEVESIKADLRMIAAAMDDRRLQGLWGDESSVVERLYSEEMLDLAQDVEDCMDRFIHRLTCKKHGESRIFRELKKIQSRSSFAEEIKKLKRRLDEARKRVIDARLPATTATTTNICGGGRPTGSTPSRGAHNPVGIVKPVEELISLLDEVAFEPEQLRVISIVGFGGLGKTTLARAVYNNHHAMDRFHCRAWVSAGRSPDINNDGVRGVLCDIFRQVCPEHAMDVDLDVRRLEASLTKYLKDKRYLIVIDDIRMEQWSTINSIFEDNGRSSRILLTTTIQSVANRCSHGNGYVYHVSTLGEQDSKEIALHGVRSPDLELGSEILLQKCDGLPLALVSVSNFLKSSSEPTGELCAKLCRNLGSHMKGKHGCDNFAELREVLLDNYENLSGYAMACLLYLGIFPNDSPLKRKVVTRRWLAEGYARSDSLGNEEDIADENFNMLVDRSIIRPIDVTNSAKVKTCKTHGIMHEFLLHKSMSQRFIAALSCDQPRTSFDANNARHLSIHGGDVIHGGASDENLSRVRSLSAFGNSANAISYVDKCELLRVLDLEECTDLQDHHLKYIDKLWHLKYLSLGGTVRNVPRSIERLHCLETLDLRRTNIKTFPIQAIQLPHLAHLFGKFMLEKDDLKNAKKISKLQKFLSEKSNLQTLAGFSVKGKQGLLQFIGQMKKLRKVKVWCEVDANGSNYLTDLSKAIQEFTKMPLDRNIDRSLSVNSEECSEGWLSSLDLEQCSEGSKYYLRSLKIHGKLLQLPPFVTLLSGLTKLCISSATLTQSLLSSLLNLGSLLYLKLIANQLESFKITRGAFPSVRRLCFVVQSLTSSLPTIEEGSLSNLASLQLLCQGLVGLSGIEIRHLKNLKDVAVDSGVTDQTRHDWEVAAKNHPNRPRLLLLKGVHSVEGERPEQEASSDGEKRQKCEPITDEKVDRMESNGPRQVVSFVSEGRRESDEPSLDEKLNGAGQEASLVSEGKSEYERSIDDKVDPMEGDGPEASSLREKRKECEPSMDDELYPMQILQLKKMKLSESSSRLEAIVPQSVLLTSSVPSSNEPGR